MKKILVIEDEPAYVRLLKDKLRQTYEVIVAQDGKSGLDMAIKEKPDLILLDIRLPQMDGMTVLSNLRKEESGKGIKVIMLTNVEANEAIVKQCVKDKPISYFVKSDVKFNDLLQKIKGLLGA